MSSFELHRPDHLDEPSWRAVDDSASRLARAWEFKDLPEVIGKSKELVETVAKVVVASTEGTISDSTDYIPTVKRAHQALRFQPGVDLAGDEDLRAIANSVQTIATRLGPLRNAYGTGHGRARVPDIVDELATIASDAAMLWSRWALRRLGHALADYPNDLIAAVQTGTSLESLRKAFVTAALAQQPDDVQHRLGVAFGQQSAGGFGNATQIGVDPAIEGGFEEYPLPYRRGLLQGMLLTAGGLIGLTDSYTARWVSLLVSLPEREAADVLAQSLDDLEGATWITSWRSSTPVSPDAIVAALRAARDQVPQAYVDTFDDLCTELERDAHQDDS